MSTTASDPTKTLELAPYIFFYGRCEEALAFYKNALGGDYSFSRIKESPMADQFPAEAQDRVMHATFTGPGITFLCSDGRETKDVDSDAGNICLALQASDRATGERIFANLSEGGKVGMPIAEVPWGGSFGMLVDRFGTEWMVSLP